MLDRVRCAPLDPARIIRGIPNHLDRDRIYRVREWEPRQPVSAVEVAGELVSGHGARHRAATHHSPDPGALVQRRDGRPPADRLFVNAVGAVDSEHDRWIDSYPGLAERIVTGQDDIADCTRRFI